MTENEYKKARIPVSQELRDQRVQSIYMARDILNDNPEDAVNLFRKAKEGNVRQQHADEVFALAERIEAWVNR